LAAAAGWDIYLHQLDHPPLEAMVALYRYLTRRGNA
jgi:peptidoglycan/xylan/chitin deacetylase (PgdA/CDA1 family)